MPPIEDKGLYESLRKMILEESGLASGPAGQESLGPYKLLESIGEGSGGTVYRALHEPLGREVALKVVSSRQLASTSGAGRFRREARILAGLRHENIVRVFDCGESETSLYLAMELIDGQTLDRWIANESPNLSTRLALLQKVARAVDHAHQSGVMHRDLKPRNLLVRRDGEPVVVDFGLARQVCEETLTRGDDALGTPHYMAPERFLGEGDSLDPRSDVFSLGVILYQCVTGDLPYEGVTPLRLHDSMQRGRFVPPSRRVATLPTQLDSILDRCLSPEPKLRYATADALAEDLDRARRGDPVLAHGSRAWSKATVWSLRRWKPITLSLLAIVLVLGASAGWHRQSARHEARHLAYSQALDITTAYQACAEGLAPLLEQAEIQRSLEGAERERFLSELDSRLATLDDKTGVAQAYRGWILYLIGDSRCRPFLQAAQEAHPDNPFPALFEARCCLRSYVESLRWPGSNGMVRAAVTTAIHPIPLETTERQLDWLQSAEQNISRCRSSEAHSPVLTHFQKLPSLRWMPELWRGFEAFASGNLEEAIEALDSLSLVGDLALEADMLLAVALSRLDRPDDAIRVASRLVARNPRYLPANAILAECYAYRGQWHRTKSRIDDAIADIERSIELYESTQDPNHENGVLFLRTSLAMDRSLKGDYDEEEYRSLVEAYSELIERHPNAYRQLVNRSNCWMSMLVHSPSPRPEWLENGLRDAKRAYEIAPEHDVPALSLVAILLEKIKRSILTGGRDPESVSHVYELLDIIEERSPHLDELLYYQASITLCEAEELSPRDEIAARPLYEQAQAYAERLVENAPSFVRGMRLLQGTRFCVATKCHKPYEDLLVTLEFARSLQLQESRAALNSRKIAGCINQVMEQPGNRHRHALATARLEWWERADEEFPTNEKVGIELARARRVLASFEPQRALSLLRDSMVTWRKATPDSQLSEWALEQRAEIHLEHALQLESAEEELREARLFAQRTLDCDSSDPYLLGLMARVQELHGERDDALNLLAQHDGAIAALRLACEFGVTLSNSSPTRYEGVRKWISLLEEAADEPSDVLDLQGAVLFRLGEYSKARDHLIDALDWNPDNARAHAYLAMTYEALGLEEEALAILEEGEQRRTAIVDDVVFEEAWGRQAQPGDDELAIQEGDPN